VFFRAVQLLVTVVCLGMVNYASPVFAVATINPVIIDVPADGRAIVTIRNDRTREVLYQVSVFSWHVVEGEDRYDATQDFIASPPLFTLAPSTSQIVRIGFRNPTQLAVEQAYRLVVAEVPRPGDTSTVGGVIELSFQYLLPVYVASSSRAAQPELLWFMHVDGNAIVVRAENHGKKREVLNMVGLSRPSAENLVPEFSSNRRVTVLAGTWREWRIPVSSEKLLLPWRIVFVNDVEIRAAVSQ